MSGTWIATQVGPDSQSVTLVGCTCGWQAQCRTRTEAQEAAEDHVCDREALT